MGNGCVRPRLPKDDLVFLLERTKFTESQIKQWHHGFMKDCPDGVLCRDKFLKIYKAIFPDGRATAFYGHVFRTFDHDRNGDLDFKEFLQAMDVTQSGLPRDRLDLAFRLYDIDNSGTLEAREILEVITSLYLLVDPRKDADEVQELAEEKATEVFAQIDVNDDGRVSRDEFVDACMEDESLYQLLSTGCSGGGK